MRASDNALLTRPFPSCISRKPRGVPRIEVRIEVDVHKQLVVPATDTTTGKVVVCETRSAGLRPRRWSTWSWPREPPQGRASSST